METIKKGSKGPQVKRWQYFLVGQGARITADGDFGEKTHHATIAFQQKNGLSADGVVGKQTYIKSFKLGYRLQEAFDYPAKPAFKALVGNRARASHFGKFKYKSAGKDVDEIIILDDWEKNNIVTLEIPQLKGVKGCESGKVRFHKKAARQLQQLFEDWEKAGLMGLIFSWDGAFYPRFVRGSRRALSNHSYGTAFDINAAWNGLGVVPPLVGENGSVRELVELANKNGFFWGGHFSSRLDGMHFEVAELKH
jgi:hypothetical protein